jgi:iron complex outermembrane receptor protein
MGRLRSLFPLTPKNNLKMKKSVLLLFLLFFLNARGFAQTTTLIGRIINEQAEGLVQSNVRVLRLTDSSTVKMINTGSNGRFELKSIPAGHYRLQISHLGLKTAYTNPLHIDTIHTLLDVGDITLTSTRTELEEIILIAKPQVVRLDDGKMIVHVGESAMKSGSSVLDMISNSPGVSVDQNGGLQLNGKSGIQVLINGRSTYLKGSDLQSFLSSLSANDLEKIEISNQPSAQQDAEGMAGVINMVFKKNIQKGFYGNAHVGYSFRHLHLYSGGAQIHYINDRWSFSLQGQSADRGQIRDQINNRRFTGVNRDLLLHQTGIDQRFGRHHSLQSDVVFEWKPGQSVGISTHALFNQINRDWETQSRLDDRIVNELSGLHAINKYKDRTNNPLASVYYRGKLDTLGSFIHADVDYVGLQRRNNATFDNQYAQPPHELKETQSLRSLSTSTYQIWASKIDYRQQFSSRQSLQIGAKWSQIDFDSDMDFKEQNPIAQQETGREEAFKYTESIRAIYAQYRNEWGPIWKLEAGLRTENTYTIRQTLLDPTSIKQQFWHFFPSIAVHQQVSPAYKVSYSFAKSISRAPFEMLNPYVFYIDPYSYVVGSPDLRPQLATTFQVTQQFYNKYILTLSYDKTDHFIGEVYQMDVNTNETIYRMANLKNFIAYGMTAYAPVRFVDKWSSSNTLTLQQQQYHMDFGATTKMRNRQLFALFQSNHTIQLPFNSALEVNATWKGPGIYGYYRVKSQWWVDAGLKMSFDPHWDLRIKSMDVFRSMQMDVKSNYNGNTNNINQYFGNQTIGFSLHYRFGNQKAVKSNPKGESLEELNRLNQQ